MKYQTIIESSIGWYSLWMIDVKIRLRRCKNPVIINGADIFSGTFVDKFSNFEDKTMIIDDISMPIKVLVSIMNILDKTWPFFLCVMATIPKMAAIIRKRL